ncbi:hypothetical protein [Rhizobium mongolense]|uniref:hypothetical protein n=1 Tax=Rhizobium mongolense TaxID=57676 RepID=UPI0011137C18|nr:hypothetical protein [Rhizobium mongolense]
MLQTVVFAENSPHDASLRDFVEHIKTQYKARELAVLYLHRGHQLDIRSPILQWLLNLLDLNRNVFAIRVEDERAAADALSMACALLGTHSNVLVLKDDLERIGLRDGRVSNEVGYTVLARDRRDVPTLRESPAPSLPTHVREMSH